MARVERSDREWIKKEPRRYKINNRTTTTIKTASLSAATNLSICVEYERECAHATMHDFANVHTMYVKSEIIASIAVSLFFARFSRCCCFYFVGLFFFSLVKLLFSSRLICAVSCCVVCVCVCVLGEKSSTWPENVLSISCEMRENKRTWMKTIHTFHSILINCLLPYRVH